MKWSKMNEKWMMVRLDWYLWQCGYWSPKPNHEHEQKQGTRERKWINFIIYFLFWIKNVYLIIICLLCCLLLLFTCLLIVFVDCNCQIVSIIAISYLTILLSKTIFIPSSAHSSNLTTHTYKWYCHCCSYSYCYCYCCCFWFHSLFQFATKPNYHHSTPTPLPLLSFTPLPSFVSRSTN